MMITVAICTYNNADVLDLTLSSLCGLAVPAGLEYEILVVDNNCTDNTSEVVEKYSKLLTNLRVVNESKQGLSHARNRVLNEAKGEIVSFIDDDVKVDPGWLAAVAEAFKKYDASLVGGKSYLIYPQGMKKPEWLSEKHEILLSSLDYGGEVLVDTHKELYGLNFSVIREVSLSVGGFDPELGRIGKRLLSGEEKDLQERIIKQGGIAVYEPNAIVGHIVPPERLSKKWFLNRAYSGAISSVYLEKKNGGKSKILFCIGRCMRCYLGLLKSIIIKDCNSEEYFAKQIVAKSNLGLLAAHLNKFYNRELIIVFCRLLCPK